MQCYAETKSRAGVLDFDDLERQAAALTGDDATAAYIQTRLDARFKHILIDEFQDTNPLQWAVLRQWLAAYGDDAARPSVFVVGDPKQAIYRFRRAEPRLFEVVRDFLAANYGATLLRTDLTRRSATAVVAALNAAFAGDHYPVFQPHATTRGEAGATWRLPLVPRPESGHIQEDAGDTALRDVLTTPVDEEESTQREEEARRIAMVLARLAAGGSDDKVAHARPRWGDVLVLVRKRDRMAPLERALRAAGIPYASDRKGGLLDTLEASDLGALLEFLLGPYSNLALAQVLKTPIFACSDEDLIRLADAYDATKASCWWEALASIDARQAPQLSRAHATLAEWMRAAGVLPVHDLLDAIYHQGRVIARYAAAVPALQREQVRANLLAYLQLALQLDSGRYPSLPRFIAELRELARVADEAPDEGEAGDAVDADDRVRILTVHGAKGLEASVVVLADAHSAPRPSESWSTLIDWPPDAAAPAHCSVFGRLAERGVAREARFEQEAALAAREDWNLLYVAATRARDVLIVSGVEAGKSRADSSWYRRVEAALDEWPHGFDSVAAITPEASTSKADFLVRDFQPHPRHVGTRIAPIAENQDQARERMRAFGVALHRVLEHCTGGRFELDAARRTARAAGLADTEADALVTMAHKLLNAPHLTRFFDAGSHHRAHNEIEILRADGRLLRIDRLVEFAPVDSDLPREIWVLDYKAQSAPVNAADVPDAYREQLSTYRAAAAALYPAHRVRTALLFGDAVLVELDASGCVVGSDA